MKRTSTGEFTPTLGLSSQAGFLLMATTPPTASSAVLSARRQRSASQSQVQGYMDEERGRQGRRGRVAVVREGAVRVEGARESDAALYL